MSYRVAVAGGGGIAARHLEAMSTMKEILHPIAIADIRQERAEELASQYGIQAYTDYKVMIEQQKPDIVIITLPHFLHREAAVFAAVNGCHMLLEKPMAMTVQECDEIILAVERSGVILMVGHTQHYIRENLAAKRIIDSGELGQLVMISDTRHVTYNRPERPDWFFEKTKAGGGILTNLGSHTVDKIQWLTQSQIVKVQASVSYLMDRGDVEGGGMAFLETDSGIPATLCQSGYAGAPRNETELIFEKGMLKLLTGDSLWISHGGPYRQVVLEDETLPFVLQLRELNECIAMGREPECSMHYSRSVVEVVEAMYTSNRIKETVVL
jgi:predicted dehydrogenase